MSYLSGLLHGSAVALASIVLASPVAAQGRTDQTVLMSENPGGRKAQDQYGFSDAVVAGDLIFLSGVVVGTATDKDDFGAAVDRTYQHIGRVLKRAGAGYDDIVDVTTFHTDIVAQIDIYAAIQKKYLKAPYSAWTAIDVDRLVPDRGLVEIKIVARKPGAQPRP